MMPREERKAEQNQNSLGKRRLIIGIYPESVHVRNEVRGSGGNNSRLLKFKYSLAEEDEAEQVKKNAGEGEKVLKRNPEGELVHKESYN